MQGKARHGGLQKYGAQFMNAIGEPTVKPADNSSERRIPSADTGYRDRM